MTPKTSASCVLAARTMARMAAFMPGESPPEVSTPIVKGLFMSILFISLDLENIEIARNRSVRVNCLRLFHNILLAIAARNMREDQFLNIGLHCQFSAL